MTSKVVQVFEAAKGTNPSKTLLAAGGAALTYGALIERAARSAAVFKRHSIAPGARAVIASCDDVESTAAFLCCIRNGVAAVMLDPRLPEREARALVEAAGAACAFVDRDKARWTDGTAPVFILDKAATKAGLLGRLLKKESDAFPAFLDGVEPVEPPRALDDSLDAYVMFTSGTTSRPKGVRISHRALFAHLATLSRQFGIDNASRILNVLPLSHADGLIQGPVSALYNGASAFRPFDFSVQRLTELFDSVYRERITHFVAVPSILAIINRLGQGSEECFSTGDLKALISTAGYLDKGLWEDFEKKFATRVSNIYGLTETVVGALFCGPADEGRRVGTIGRPVDCEAMIALDDGKEAAEGAPGELLLRGANLMTGYLDDEDSTKEALQGGWLHTGDIATRDSDGFFRITGRKKNIIISGGLNIQPEEVTDALTEHPEVLEAATFGVEDPVFGEVAVSCVVLSPGATAGPSELAAWCRDRLAQHKIPQQIYVLQGLPKGRTGKVIVDETKKMALEAAGALAGDHDNILERVLGAAASTFKTLPGELSGFSTPANVAGWDSLAHLHLIVALEEAFGIRLDPSDIIMMDSLGEAERIVRAKLSA